MSNENYYKIRDYLVKHLPKAGYEVVRTDVSFTNGLSLYIFAWLPEFRLNLKIRISDHSVGLTRMREEITVSSMSAAKTFLKKRWKLKQRNTHRYETLMVRESDVQEDDIIKRTETRKNGSTWMQVRRGPIFEKYLELK